MKTTFSYFPGMFENPAPTVKNLEVYCFQLLVLLNGKVKVTHTVPFPLIKVKLLNLIKTLE